MIRFLVNLRVLACIEACYPRIEVDLGGHKLLYYLRLYSVGRILVSCDVCLWGLAVFAMDDLIIWVHNVYFVGTICLGE